LKKLAHVPPELKQHPSTLARQYSEPIADGMADDPNEVHRREMDVFQGVCKLAAIELSVQPFIRNLFKKHVYSNYELSTTPTEQGQKDLDLFNQSYRVKRIKGMDLRKLKTQSDLFLDIEQCEKTGLIKVEIKGDAAKREEFKEQLASFYMQRVEGSRDWNIMRSEVIRILYEDILSKEIVKEIRDEIKEEAENFVITRCKEAYREMCLTGPFTTTDPNVGIRFNEDVGEKRGKKYDGDVIKDRDRLNVAGAIMHQIDQNNFIVTVAFVNKYGDLVNQRDFKRLLPPRARRP
jgi:transcriptional accessory protein Tex/SPT6